MAYCGQCGFKNPDGARFCGECGADLTLQEVGNVENIVNESGEAPTMDENAMEYVPLDTPSEVTEPVEVTPASTFEPDAPTPVTAEQQPVQPTPPAPPAPQEFRQGAESQAVTIPALGVVGEDALGIFFVALFFFTGLFCGWIGYRRHKSTMQEIERNLKELEGLSA